jgi:menaquinone-9 beta-reductase
MIPTDATPEYDVAVVGAGLGGLAASIFLRQVGLRVVCIEPEPFPHARVGESLDWSTPGLLADLGFSRDELIRRQIGTYKRNFQVESLGQRAFVGEPNDWLCRKPLEFEITTLHVDRVQFDQQLFEMAQELEVSFIWDRVSTLETDGERVVALHTASNQRISSTWFIDGSGQAQVFGKAFEIPKVEYGPRKVALWTYFGCPLRNEGTSFYGDNADEYLSWIWEIPITPSTISVGYVVSADQLQEDRRNNEEPKEILRRQLTKHPRFAPLLSEQPDLQVRTMSYRNYVNQFACGPNWLLVGESASMPDPATANGVTAAFRHAQLGATLLRASRGRGSLSARQRHIYDTNVRRMGHAFNHSIETAVYRWQIRWGLNVRTAVKVYTAFGYVTNALYSKFRPQSHVGATLFGLLLHAVHFWMESWSLIGKLAFRIRRSANGSEIRT